MATAEVESTTEAIAGKVLGDISSTMATILAALGDLFKALAGIGPATAGELAGRRA